jgi:hypothetical protein
VKFTQSGGKVNVNLQRINSHVEISVADSVPELILTFSHTYLSGSDKPTAQPPGPMADSAWAWRLSDTWLNCTAEWRQLIVKPGKRSNLHGALPLMNAVGQQSPNVANQ